MGSRQFGIDGRKSKFSRQTNEDISHSYQQSNLAWNYLKEHDRPHKQDVEGFLGNVSAEGVVLVASSQE